MPVLISPVGYTHTLFCREHNTLSTPKKTAMASSKVIWKKPVITSCMFFYSLSPINTPETFQALKLPPSGLPKGMATWKVCLPGARSGKGISTGKVMVPGHQLERLRSDED